MTTPAQRGLKGPPSPRQNEVLLLVGQGLTNIEIGDRLGIGDRTVKQHCEKLKAKFNVRKKRDLVPIAQMTQQERDTLIGTVQRANPRPPTPKRYSMRAAEVLRDDAPVERKGGTNVEHGAVIWDEKAKEILDRGDAQ